MVPNVTLAAPLACLGVYAGSLLTEAVVLVPTWRRMPAAELYRLHPALGRRLFRYFAPITALGVALPALHLAIGFAFGARPPITEWLAVALCGGALASYFGYFQHANRRIGAQSLSAKDLEVELETWERVHWARTLAVLLAFALLSIAHT